MRKIAWAGCATAWVWVAGCGGAQDPSAKTSQPTANLGSAQGHSHAAAPTASAANETDEDTPNPAELQGVPQQHLPPGEKGMIPLQLLLPVPDPSPPGGFPAATTTDKECVKSVGLLGQLDKDFAAITSSCGSATGMKEYVKAVSGKIDAGHKRDTFQVMLAGGYCYRFFAVADGSISKLGFRVHRANGALHSVILGKQPVFIYRANDPWCRRRDRDFQLVVEALDGGEGRYAFGIWARPNEKGRAR